MLMDTDIEISREQVQRLFWACQDKMDTEDLVGLLASIQGLAEREGLDGIRVAYRDGRPDPADSRLDEAVTKLHNTRMTLTQMVGAFASVVDTFSTDLTARGRDTDCHELLERAGEVMQHVADSFSGNLPPGEFATPPGSIGVWAVADPRNYEEDDLLFLSRELAERQLGGSSAKPRPALLWAVRPQPVDMWFVQVLLSADGFRLRSVGQTRQLKDQDPNDHALSLVNPTTDVYSNRHGGWSIDGWGTDLDTLNAAVEAAAAAKTAEIQA